MDEIPSGRLLDLAEALGSHSRRIETIRGVWQRRLEKILGEGELSFVRKDGRSLINEGRRRKMYEFCFTPKGGKISYTVKTYYDFWVSDDSVSESHAIISMPSLHLGRFGPDSFLPNKYLMDKFYSAIQAIEATLGSAPEPCKVKSDPTEKSELGWIEAPKYLKEVLGEGYINTLEDSVIRTFMPKSYGYLCFKIREDCIRFGDEFGITAMDYFDGRFNPNGELTYLKQLIDRLSGPVHY
jgi:hypothetical protein